LPAAGASDPENESASEAVSELRDIRAGSIRSGLTAIKNFT
jgi:hypothetical protein